MKIKRLTLCGLLTAVAIVLGWVERLFPLDAVIPVPGLKLGLANVVTLFALTQLTKKQTSGILLCRVLIVSVLFGSVTSLVFSLVGSLLAMLAMMILLRFPNTFSLCGVSVAGAAAHNLGQIATAVVWMGTDAVLVYLPPLLVLSIPLGLVTGYTCLLSLIHLKKIGVHA